MEKINLILTSGTTLSSSTGGASEDTLLQETFSLCQSFCCITPSHSLNTILPLPAPPAPSNLTSSLSPPPSCDTFPAPSYFSLPHNTRLSHLNPSLFQLNHHSIVNTLILSTVCLIILGIASPSPSTSLSNTMQSSTLYGPVTKVTAGKYIVQVANKGIDKTKEKSSEVKDRGKEKQVRIKEKKESEKNNEGTSRKKRRFWD